MMEPKDTTLAGALPRGLVLSGGGLAIGAFLCGVSALAFAIGVYLPLASMAAIYVGGCVRALCERGMKDVPAAGGAPGILAASGLVAGEGLAGVLTAGLVAGGVVAKSNPAVIGGPAGEIVAVAMILLICAFLYRSAQRR